jgi:hypothetical protein
MAASMPRIRSAVVSEGPHKVTHKTEINHNISDTAVIMIMRDADINS